MGKLQRTQIWTLSPGRRRALTPTRLMTQEEESVLTVPRPFANAKSSPTRWGGRTEEEGTPSKSAPEEEMMGTDDPFAVSFFTMPGLDPLLLLNRIFRFTIVKSFPFN